MFSQSGKAGPGFLDGLDRIASKVCRETQQASR